MSLSPKHRAFVNEYLDCFNATEAYMRVYAPKRRETAEVNASRLLSNAMVAEAIEARIKEKTMKVDEALARLSDMARGDLADFMDISGMGFSIALREAKEAGKTHLIKKVKQKTTTFLAKSESDEDREVHEIEIELHDPQAAIDKLLKVNGAYINRLELTGKDGSDLTINVKVTDDGDED